MWVIYVALGFVGFSLASVAIHLVQGDWCRAGIWVFPTVGWVIVAWSRFQHLRERRDELDLREFQPMTQMEAITWGMDYLVKNELFGGRVRSLVVRHMDAEGKSQTLIIKCGDGWTKVVSRMSDQGDT